MRGYDSILFDMTSQARNNYKMIEDILNRLEMNMLKSCHVTKMSIHKNVQFVTDMPRSIFV